MDTSLPLVLHHFKADPATARTAAGKHVDFALLTLTTREGSTLSTLPPIAVQRDQLPKLIQSLQALETTWSARTPGSIPDGPRH